MCERIISEHVSDKKNFFFANIWQSMCIDMFLNRMTEMSFAHKSNKNFHVWQIG